MSVSRIVDPVGRGKWAVRDRPQVLPTSLHNNCSEAIEAARREVIRRGGGEVIIRDTGGQVTDVQFMSPSIQSQGGGGGTYSAAPDAYESRAADPSSSLSDGPVRAATTARGVGGTTDPPQRVSPPGSFLQPPEATEKTRTRARVFLALLLGAGTVAVMVFLAFSVSSDRLRLIFFIVACLLAAAVVLVLPPHWRKRLGPPTAVFIAAGSALSVFLVNPQQPGAPEPKVDTQEMVNAILVGPFDQRLPQSVTAEDPVRSGTRDATAIENVGVVKVQMISTTFGGGTAGKDSGEGQIEVYPTPEAAAARAQGQYDWRSGREEAARNGQPEPKVGKNTPEMWCFVDDRGSTSSSQWQCGGYRGHAYVETYMPFGNQYTNAQAIQSALLRYAENKETLATETR
ncbi:MAG: DUF2188 domain-containing protein [Rhodococcus sp. (in: high G+C Gram-positive bacteria)]|nr:MAG: DUF2188 domain-containing protein [Rhodococcus sp. (in: high G+C Gram-positive bacteria)]